MPYSPESQLGSVPKDGQDLATRCLSGVSTTRSLKGGFSQPKAERQAVEGVGKKNLLPPAATSDAKKQKQTNKNMELENASQVLNFLDWKIQNEAISSTLIPIHTELLNTQFDCL